MSYRGAHVLQSAKSQQPSATAGRKAWLILLIALAITVLEGAFRKWVFPAGAMKNVMYFSKDIVFVALLLLPEQKWPSAATRVFKRWLFPGCVLVALGAALSSLSGFNLVGAILTARAAVVLPLVAWLAVPRLAGLPLRWLLWLLLACTVVNFALSVEQNRLPAGHILNRYAAEEAPIVVEHSGVRATGTFAYITGLSIMSTVGVWAGIALMSVARNHWERAAGLVALAGGFGCGMASISRGPIYIGLAMLGGCFAFSRHWRSNLARSLVVVVLCTVIAAAVGLSSIFSNLQEGWQDRAARSKSDTFQHRAVDMLALEGVGIAQQVPLGDGFGTYQAGAYFVGGGRQFFTSDSQLPRMILETGILGLVGFLIICAGAILALQSAKLTATKNMKTVLLATQLFLLITFYTASLFNHTGSAFAWFIFAAVLAARE